MFYPSKATVQSCPCRKTWLLFVVPALRIAKYKDSPIHPPCYDPHTICKHRPAWNPLSIPRTSLQHYSSCTPLSVSRSSCYVARWQHNRLMTHQQLSKFVIPTFPPPRFLRLYLDKTIWKLAKHQFFCFNPRIATLQRFGPTAQLRTEVHFRQPALIPRSRTRILQNRSYAPVLVAATSLSLILLPRIQKPWYRSQLDHTPHQGYYNGKKQQESHQGRKLSSKTPNLSPAMSPPMRWPSTPRTWNRSSRSRQ